MEAPICNKDVVGASIDGNVPIKVVLSKHQPSCRAGRTPPGSNSRTRGDRVDGGVNPTKLYSPALTILTVDLRNWFVLG